MTEARPSFQRLRSEGIMAHHQPDFKLAILQRDLTAGSPASGLAIPSPRPSFQSYHSHQPGKSPSMAQGARNFSRPVPPVMDDQDASDEPGSYGFRFGQDEASSSSRSTARPLTHTSQSSNLPADGTARSATAHSFLLGPPDESVFPAGKENRLPSVPSSTSGMVSRLKSAASGSNLARTFTKKKAASSSANRSIDVGSDSPRPSMATDDEIFDGSSTGHSDRLLGPLDAGLLRGRKSSFSDLRSKMMVRNGSSSSSQDNVNQSAASLQTPPESGEKTAKKGKGQFWTALRSKTAQASEVSLPSLAASEQRPTSPPPVPAKGSKLDRLLGVDEEERRRLASQHGRLRPGITQDLLEEFSFGRKSQGTKSGSMDLLRNDRRLESSEDVDAICDLPAMLPSDRPDSRHRHNDSTSSKGSSSSFATASSGSRVADHPPFLDHPIGFAERELSDDIAAVLRSNRSSVRGVEDILNAQRAISKRSSSLRNSVSSGNSSLDSHTSRSARRHRRKQSSLDSASSLSSYAPSRPSHLANLSISSEYSTTSTRSESTSITSEGEPSPRWAAKKLPTKDEKVVTRPRTSSRAALMPVMPRKSSLRAQMQRQHSEPLATFSTGPIPSQFEDADDEPSSPHPYAFPSSRPPMVRAAQTYDASANSQLPMAQKSSHRESLKASYAPLPDVTPLQNQTARTLQGLPPLASLLDACLLAQRTAVQNPWQSLAHAPLTASDDKELTPSSWSSYLEAYARGEMDISRPPRFEEPSLRSVASRRTLSRSREPSSGADSPGLGGDFAFPMPPSRQNGTTSSALDDLYDLLNPPRVSCDTMDSFATSKTLMTRDGRPEVCDNAGSSCKGDMQAPQPPFEVDRQQETARYVSAIGIDAADASSAPAYRSSRLLAIVDRLTMQLNVPTASIQLLTSSQVIVLAKQGHLFGEDDQLLTPRGGDVSMALGMAFGAKATSTSKSRDRSLDAHAILSADGTPVVFADLQADWRFLSRDCGTMSFYAAASILSVDTGMPIGTISARNHMSRAGGLTREEHARLVQAAREVSLELERIRKMALSRRLSLLDESLSSWSRGRHNNSTARSSDPLTEELNTLNLTSEDVLSGSNTLAERRGAKPPRSLAVGSLDKAKRRSMHPQHDCLVAALRTIMSVLEMDVAYIARVRRQAVGQDTNESVVTCSVIVQDDDKTLPKIQPDGPLHLCALTATKRGLVFQNDSHRASQLLGSPASEGPSPLYHTAASVSCGLTAVNALKTDGWVLTVASRKANSEVSPESLIYLLRFGGLLTPFLLDGEAVTSANSSAEPRSASRASRLSIATSSVDHNGTRARSISNPRRPNTLFSPTGSLRSRSGAMSPADLAKRKLPPFSPPPDEPLPLLPSTPSPVTRFKALPPVIGLSLGRTPPLDPLPALPPPPSSSVKIASTPLPSIPQGRRLSTAEGLPSSASTYTTTEENDFTAFVRSRRGSATTDEMEDLVASCEG